MYSKREKCIENEACDHTSVPTSQELEVERQAISIRNGYYADADAACRHDTQSWPEPCI